MSELFGVPECADAEDIVKGFLTTDLQNGVIRPALFRGRESSYSRQAVYSLERIVEIFRAQLPRPPEKLLAGYLLLNVGTLKKLGKAYQTKEVKDGIAVRVVPVPLQENQSHAETRPNITDGLSKVFRDSGIKLRVDLPPPTAAGNSAD